MPDLIGPLLPVFDADSEIRKGVRKAELYVLTYALAITVAKKVPRTAPVIHLLTGVRVVPGRGISVHPAALVITGYAPQPIGIMPPSYYNLPNSIGDPFKTARSLRDDPSGDNLRAIWQDDLFRQEQEAAKRRAANAATRSALEKQLAADLAAGTVPTPPTFVELVQIQGDRIALPPLTAAGNDAPSRFGPGVPAALDDAFADLAALTAARGREQGFFPLNEPDQPVGGADQVVGQLQRLQAWAAANPPDP